MSGQADEVLGNRYRLIAPVGTGGMAVVWRARDLVLDRDVAVKLLAGELASKPGNRERIRAEAQVVARLQHPNITAVHDYGEAGELSEGRNGRRPYVVMELLAGELLSDRLRSGPMSWRRATQICAQVAAGLAAAHERGVVHRDIKPSNIMLTSAGAKILDFGVAGLTGSLDPDDEHEGRVFGTPAYLAPERLLGGGVTPATDVYTVGLLVYRCLTDRLPWHADTPTQMIANHVYEPPHPLPGIPGLPEEIPGLVGSCLAKDPEARPQAVEVARILAAATGIHVVLPGEDGSSTQEVHAPPIPPPQPAQVLAAPGRERADVTTRRARLARRRRRRTWAAVVAAVVATGATTGVVIWRPWVARPACQIDFYIRPAALGSEDRAFEARVTVANTGNRTLDPWVLVFRLPGGQTIERMDGVLRYRAEIGGMRVTGEEALPPGKAVTFGVDGYGGQPVPPEGFAVNDTDCDTRVAQQQPDEQLPGLTGGVIDAPKDADRPASRPANPPPGGGPPGGGPPPGGRRPEDQQPPPSYGYSTPPAQRTRKRPRVRA
ncbi:protein kinase [Dactylosporangium sp. AC04546]|uniref:protein kinase domain-containing protein n=1 Tax=Dactylosporangium sp. AC04546 TaxID=2862460 RepID=UPI001EE1364A|nr:protein kinase [Dactylosporangium sp. AC04546]WVK85846.1 protein kinase [Dactylosporangium sp. AC04546]